MQTCSWKHHDGEHGRSWWSGGRALSPGFCMMRATRRQTDDPLQARIGSERAFEWSTRTRCVEWRTIRFHGKQSSLLSGAASAPARTNALLIDAADRRSLTIVCGTDTPSETLSEITTRCALPSGATASTVARPPVNAILAAVTGPRPKDWNSAGAIPRGIAIAATVGRVTGKTHHAWAASRDPADTRKASISGPVDGLDK